MGEARSPSRTLGAYQHSLPPCALGLIEPFLFSEATKDRFISMYHLPQTTIISVPTNNIPSNSDHKNSQSTGSPPLSRKLSQGQTQSVDIFSSDEMSPGGLPKIITTLPTPLEGKVAMTSIEPKTKDSPFFNITVLEMIKLIQAALSIFGLFPVDSEDGEEIDGLLCDVTVDGIQRWVTDTGEPCLGVEPTERVADPMAVGALLSLVLAIRNKLATISLGNASLYVLFSAHAF